MENLDFTYILSQIFTILVYTFTTSTYFLKKQHKIIIVNSLALVANLIAYSLLGAWTGLAMTVVAIFRNFLILWKDKHYGKSKKIERRDFIFLFVIIFAIILATIPTYTGPLSLLSVFATLTYTYSIWQKSTKVYKFCGIFVSSFAIAYHAYIRSIFGVILESIVLVAAIIGFITEIRRHRSQ